MIPITEEQAKDLNNLTKYPEYQTLKHLLKEYVDSIDRVSDIPEQDLVVFGGIAAARKIAHEKVTEFFETIGMFEKSKGLTTTSVDPHI